MQPIQRRSPFRFLSVALSFGLAGGTTAPAALANGAGLSAWAPVHPSAVGLAPHPALVHQAQIGTVFSQFNHSNTFGKHQALPLGAATFATGHRAGALDSASSFNYNLDLGSPKSIFQAGGLAGFRTIVLDIGGKRQTVDFDTRLTAAELVAAQEVLNNGKQDIKINASGVAVGGSLILNTSMLSAIDKAIGGDVVSLGISHGLKVIDSLANLDLSGSLNNRGTIIVAGASDVISVGSINNSGVIKSARDLNLVSNNIVNSGVIGSDSGNVNITSNNSAGNIVLSGAHGSVQALKGNINLAGENITINGGDYLSKQLNLNAPTGAISVDAGTITGLVSGSAASSHVIAATDTLNLGNICVSGDPTYYNTAGDIVISGVLNGNPDLALVASGNIIANGGAINTSQGSAGNSTAHGGNILLVAGANFDAPTTGSALPPNGDTTTSIVLGNNPSAKANTNAGSKTGGYIDLSGITLTGSSTNKALTLVSSAGTTGAGGDISMFAYGGSGKNAGSIVATATAAQGGAGMIINAAGGAGSAPGDVSISAGGKSLTAGTIVGDSVKLATGALNIEGGGNQSVVILNGTVQSGSGIITAATNNGGTVSVGNISGATSVSTASAGIINITGTVQSPSINLTASNSIDVNQADAGGVGAIAGSATTSGGHGGFITFTAPNITVGYVDASGGGGAGGNFAGASGGAGGSGGDVSFIQNSTSGKLTILNQVNASGGGGGGGAGAALNSIPGPGGAGGIGGSVLIHIDGTIVGTAPGSLKSSIIAVDGGAGGAGATNISGNGGNGGGGGGAFGGGGGGGAAAASSVGTTSGGGGGGGSAGGGGGGSVNKSGATAGGSGGSSRIDLTTGMTTGGAGGNVGSIVLNGQPGSGNNSFAGIGGNANAFVPSGGIGGTLATGGSGGATTGASGGAGNFATTLAGTGSFFLFAPAAASSASPLSVDAGTYHINSNGTKAGIFYLASHDTADLAVAINSSSTYSMQSEGDIFGDVQAKSVSLNATTIGSQVLVTNNSSSGITLLNSSTGSGGFFSLQSKGLLSVTGNISSPEGTISLVSTSTVPTDGIKISGLLLTGTSGVVGLSSSYGSITSSKEIVASTIDLSTLGTVGTLKAPLLTGTAALAINALGTAAVYVKDATTSKFTLDATNSQGGTLSVISAAKAENVVEATFGNVNLQNTFVGSAQNEGTFNLGTGGTKTIGDGFGSVTITGNFTTIQSAQFGSVVSGSNVVVTSTNHDIGQFFQPLVVNAPQFSAFAPGGSVYIADKVAAIVNGVNAPGNVNVSAPGLTIDGPITGAIVPSTTMSVSASSSPLVINASIGTSATLQNGLSGSPITQTNAKALVSGVNVSLFSFTGGIGQSVFTGSNILTAAGKLLTVGTNTAANTYITQTGPVTVSQSGGVTQNIIWLTDNTTLTLDGSIKTNQLLAFAPTVNVLGTANLTIGSLTAQTSAFNVAQNGLLTISSAATFLNAGPLSIAGAGKITMQPQTSLTLGGTAIFVGKPTTSITLGDAGSGANNPLAASLTNDSITSLSVNTTGNLVSNLPGFTVGAHTSTGVGGFLSITAANVVAIGAGSSPIILSASGAAAKGDGSIVLNLTGTQGVVLDSTATSGQPLPYELQIDGGGGSGGSISVTTGGNLSVFAGGIQRGSATNIVLASAKSLAVENNSLSGLQTINNLSLSSGASTPFVVDGGAGVLSGTAGPLSAVTVTIQSLSPIVTSAVGDIKAASALEFFNPKGVLSISGPVGSIQGGFQLILNAATGITIGDAKSGANDPLPSFSTLSYLDASTIKGNFSIGTSTFTLAPQANGSGGSLSIMAANILTPGVSNTIPLLFSTNASSNSFAAGVINISLSGTQSVVIDGNNTATGKTPNFYVLSDTGANGTGFVSVRANGALDVQQNGIVTGSELGTLTLSGGKSLLVNAPALSSGSIDVISLSSNAAAPFVVGPGVGSSGVNGVEGYLAARQSVTIADRSAITIASGGLVSNGGGNLSLITQKLTNNGVVSSTGNGQLIIGSSSTPSVSVVNGGNAIYSNFTSVQLVSAGAFNAGTLFSSAALLSGNVSEINISCVSTFTLASATPTINCAPSGDITINVGAFASKSTGSPIIIGPTTGSASDLSITTKSAMTIGSGKGNIQLSGVNATATEVDLTSTTGVLTIATGLNAGDVNLQGASVAVKAPIQTFFAVISASSKSGAITTSGATINATDALILANGSPTLAKVPITIDTPDLTVSGFYGGALFIQNAHAGAVQLSSEVFLPAVSSLTYNSAAGTNSDLTVSTIATVKGNLNINNMGTGSIIVSTGSVLAANGGGINLIASNGSVIAQGSSQLTTQSGSITLQALSSSVLIGDNVTIHASGTKAGVGQVNIVRGPIPALADRAPGSVNGQAALLTSGGSNITLTIAANPSGGITAGTNNLIYAQGRDVVFSTNGASNANITLGNNDVIIADPPAASAGARIVPVIEQTASQHVVSPPVGIATVSASTNLPPLLASAAFAFASPEIVQPVRLAGLVQNNKQNIESRELAQGPLLLSPAHDTVVSTPFGVVTVKARSVALIIAFDGGLAVYNLHDSRRGSVVAEVDGRIAQVGPGRSVVMTRRDVESFEQVNPAGFVGYRRLSAQEDAGGLKTFKAEFDQGSLFAGVKPLRALIGSRSGLERELSQSVLKTAAILMSQPSSEPFQIMARVTGVQNQLAANTASR